MLTAERSRRAQAPRWLGQSLDRTIRALERELGVIDQQIAARLEHSAVLKPRRDLITSVPGVGPVLSATWLARRPELGRLNRGAIAALAGVAPYTRHRGQWRGQAMIRGGRAPVRTALYMATLSAVRFNPALQSFYRRLRAAGKTPKLALTACMRKLFVILNAMLKHSTPWRSPCPAAL